ncbi:ATP-dependent zinc metalloprotease FtsH, partial [Streptomyces sp. NPDC003483]
RIIGALGGMAAEHVVYGVVTTGSENDLEQVTRGPASVRVTAWVTARVPARLPAPTPGRTRVRIPAGPRAPG